MSFHRVRDEEAGAALVTTLLVSFVLMMLVTGLTTYAVGSLPLSRHDQDWNAALSVAEAGIDDYIFRMNQDANYWT